jgi:large conductance mechanosensitive channel
MGMLKEFKEFAIKGNLIDMAVGVVMGGAFGKVVSSFIDGMVMPAIGMLTGGVDFNDKVIKLKDAVAEVIDAAGVVVTPASPEVAIKYGAFISQIITFTVVAAVVFIVIKAINKMKKEEAAAAPPAPTAEEVLLTEIRDLLKK